MSSPHDTATTDRRPVDIPIGMNPPAHRFRDGRRGGGDVLRERRRFYVPVGAKFLVALILATAWLVFSVIVSRPWLEDLSALSHPLVALFCLTFIAYAPGFMNAFLIVSLLLDRRPPRLRLDHYPGLTILVAAYQEERTIIHTLASLARERYPGEIEILVLNDGSTDRTAEQAERGRTGLHYPSNVTLRIINYAENRGKAAVLNSGLQEASHSLIVTVDADTRLRADSLTKIVERYEADPPETRAVAGAILVGNSRDSMMAGLQEWDYFHGIAAVKRMQSMYHGTLVAQGAFSIYDRDALIEIGGWPECVGEDIVMTWALLKRGYRTGYAEDAVAFTSAPTTYRQFAHQRRRWARGLIEAFHHHKGLTVKPRLSTMFIWWNVLFLPMDLVFTLVFIPGVIVAFFGLFWIAGPMTLLTLPLAALWNIIIYRIQKRMFRESGLKVRQNYRALLLYIVGYAVLMQPVSLWGYVSELIGRQKKWGTK
ncbi:glycosyltransferase [Sphingomonas sp. LY29]|uniref:glycosyltransferase n=1 Tax=Sphingomonas sp. LY29 TaxID=3095341 RepID=UPI002D77942E|nr:glycosyltransferase [Sphingomonas sp. LY29]WRP26552.1 glycosyltransferase [Sphingomonas sp. LY29]